MDIINIIKKGEFSKIEFKENLTHSDSIAGEIVSFLNASGGMIFFGISDKKEIIGIENIKDFEEKITNISRNNIFPEVILNFEISNIENKDIFILKIPLGKNKPYEVNKTRKKYIRVGTTKREVSREEELILWQASGNLKYDNIEINTSNINEIDKGKIKNFIDRKYGKTLEDVGVSYENLLQNLDICKIGIDNEIYPTFTGLYFFGKSDIIRKRINSSYIICAYFKGTDIGNSEILDKKEIEGDFVEIFDDTINFIHKYNAEYRKIEGFDAKIKYDYLIEAIRETLVNAMIHRDYTYTGANIRIFMFEDRIEIISPGNLPNGLTIDILNSGIYQRFTRNEYLMNFATKFFSRIIESLGSGINRINSLCKEGNYPKPKYSIDNNQLKVTYLKSKKY
ncbi:MAG: putative DNA binding domain-containing protein [Candidatus Gracilibacteria bacterium]|nr:putative DNA binding domain-containing protein [Candidatus Gracilibacteria bacterium]MDQ7022708.1 putative DNA binding domain-containing protein [Candidatus Gracilibacteria bacterium]